MLLLVLFSYLFLIPLSQDKMVDAEIMASPDILSGCDRCRHVSDTSGLLDNVGNCSEHET